MKFNKGDLLEYSHAFKKILSEADYLKNAIHRKFIYVDAKYCSLNNEYLAELKCVTHGIPVKVSVKHLRKSK